MASASPALHATRPAGHIDLRKPGDYPIVLGDSLRSSSPTDSFLNLRFNWQPKNGFPHDNQSLLKPTKDGYSLTVRDPANSQQPTFVFSGNTRDSSTTSNTSSLALIFDKKENVFKLESLSKSLDLNLESTSSKTFDVKRFPSLPKSATKSKRDHSNINGDKTTTPSIDDNTPDPNNPFDFRNFLTEAKDSLERAALAASESIRTQAVGNRTPLGGFASPVHGASRPTSTTPQFNARVSSPIPQKRRTDSPHIGSKTASPMRQKPAQKKRKLDPISSHKHALSKEQISDSDDELSDSLIPQPRTSTPKPPAGRGHTRTTSSVSNSGFAASPHIVVNDGDLEIDMGSPPPESRGRQRGRIDPGAFGTGSAAGTPVFRGNSNTGATKRPLQRDLDDVEIDLGGDYDEAEGRESSDNDVDELALGSPRAGAVRAGQGHQGSRSASSVVKSSHQQQHQYSNSTSHQQHRYSNSNSSLHQQQENAPTPTNAAALDDDDEDLLAKELEAALGDEDADAGNANVAGTGGYGLGITGAQAVAGNGDGDDESDVSEEE
jgi:RNA polymerase II transcription elongation factor